MINTIKVIIIALVLLLFFVFHICNIIKSIEKDREIAEHKIYIKNSSSSRYKAEYRKKLEKNFGKLAFFSIPVSLIIFYFGYLILSKMNLLSNCGGKPWALAIYGCILACAFISCCCLKGYMSQKANLIEFFCTFLSMCASLISYLLLKLEENWIFCFLVMYYLTVNSFIQLYKLLDI